MRFEKMAGLPSVDDVGPDQPEDHRHELRLMARRAGMDEAELTQLRDVPPAWSTVTGAPTSAPNSLVKSRREPNQWATVPQESWRELASRIKR